ncbi:MAG: glycoside hydrolase domain-containing protein [Planctomycetota bacterium]
MYGRTLLRAALMLAAAALWSFGCQLPEASGPGAADGSGAVLDHAPMADATQAVPRRDKTRQRIDLVDGETEGFHFQLPADLPAVTRWELVMVEPPSAAAGSQTAVPAAPPRRAVDPVAMPPVASVPNLPPPAPPPDQAIDAAILSARYFLTVRFFDCLTVDNPLAAVALVPGAREHQPDALVPMEAGPHGDGFVTSLPVGDPRAGRHVWVDLTWQVDSQAAAAEPARRLHGLHHFFVRGRDAAGRLRVQLALDAHFYNVTLPVQGRFCVMADWNTTIAGYYGWPELPADLRRVYYAFFLSHRISPTSFHSQRMEPGLDDLPFCVARGQNCLNLYTVEATGGRLTNAAVDAIRHIAETTRDPLQRMGLTAGSFILAGDVRADPENTTETGAGFGAAGGANAKAETESILANVARIHDLDPDAHVWLFGAPSAPFQNKIDAWSPLTAADTPAFAPISYDRARRLQYARNNLTLWYVGQEPVAPNVNLLLSNPVLDAHILGVQMWANNVAGLVLPQVTDWPWGGGTAASGFPAAEWQARRDGLGVLCYPLPSGAPCSSVRLENLRDGVEHAEALREAEWLLYDFAQFEPTLDKDALPALREHLQKAADAKDAGGAADETQLRAKLALTEAQRAALPAARRALEAVLTEDLQAYHALDLTPTAADGRDLMRRRRELYAALERAEALVRGIMANLASPAPAAGTSPGAESAPAGAAAAGAGKAP